mgnify:FL=1|jgi:Rps23 Pro-64 3,4-dihydroxylase Tpa1-like proline 4-hydroxylase
MLNEYPFPHIICKEFVPLDLIEKVKKEYDEILNNELHEWVEYNNPIEHKLSFNKFKNTTYLKQLLPIMGNPEFINHLQNTFGIEDIELDTDLYGAGLHNHPRGGHLCTHLDYEINPITFKKRWLNLILYINDDWKDEYNGDTELWNNDRTICEKRVYPEFNKALIFRTDNKSWHGVSREICCPVNKSRKSIAFYYVSKRSYKDDVDDNTRMKALFYDPKYPKLCEIRSKRQLTKKDIEEWEQKDA